jgi:dTDP-4-amino-4,6-dideoxygalactose transaminase
LKFVDLEAQQNGIKALIDLRMQAVLSQGQYINGPEVKELEGSLAEYVGVKHAIGCASGTDALLMALMACRVGPGDAIFTTPFTFIATAEVISLLGAVPVFVDIDPGTMNIDPAKLEPAIQALARSNERQLRPKGIIPVDLFGLPADYDRINAIARSHGLFVIEDAAQSFGADYNNKKCCSLADIGCTSFFPAKPLGCYGDGGMCFTDNNEIAETLESIRSHGMGADKYDNVRIGINGRLDTLQAAILLAKFQIFPEEVRLRQGKATVYRDALIRGVSETLSLTPQSIPPGSRSAWAQYSIMAQDEEHRSKMQNVLKNAGIPTAIYYPKPLHLQKVFSSLGYREGDFPVSEDSAKRIFSIPMHPYLAERDQKMIIETMFCASAAECTAPPPASAGI